MISQQKVKIGHYRGATGFIQNYILLIIKKNNKYLAPCDIFGGYFKLKFKSSPGNAVVPTAE